MQMLSMRTLHLVRIYVRDRTGSRRLRVIRRLVLEDTADNAADVTDEYVTIGWIGNLAQELNEHIQSIDSQ